LDIKDEFKEECESKFETRDKTEDEHEVKSKTWTESFPPATITIDINSDAAANATGDSESNANATSETISTATATSTVNANNTRTSAGEDGMLNVATGGGATGTGDGHVNGEPIFWTETSEDGGGDGGWSDRDSTVDATVYKKHKDLDVDVDTTQTLAEGDAAVARADAEGHEQAYAVSAAEGKAEADADADVDLHLPTASSGTLNSDKTETKTESRFKEESKCKTETKFEDKSQLEIVIADHVKIGNGSQNITDETEYDVKLRDDAQGAATALNIINVAGRNNMAVAWNLASSTGGAIGVSPFVGGGAISTPDSISQLNVVKQVN
jgi:hypothetical protein